MRSSGLKIPVNGFSDMISETNYPYDGVMWTNLKIQVNGFIRLKFVTNSNFWCSNAKNVYKSEEVSGEMDTGS